MNNFFKISFITLTIGGIVYLLFPRTAKGMKLSSRGRALIKNFEGLKLTAYKDGDGYSVGYGHWIKGDAQKGKTITLAQAESLFNQDIAYFENVVNKALNVEVTQNMFDSLVSFAYNRGEGTFRKSTILANVNNGQYFQAGKDFLSYDANMDSLRTRRIEESKLFLS